MYAAQSFCRVTPVLRVARVVEEDGDGEVGRRVGEGGRRGYLLPHPRRLRVQGFRCAKRGDHYPSMREAAELKAG
jgi:hypothetical protein